MSGEIVTKIPESEKAELKKKCENCPHDNIDDVILADWASIVTICTDCRLILLWKVKGPAYKMLAQATILDYL